jgi:hypothetical protein
MFAGEACARTAASHLLSGAVGDCAAGRAAGQIVMATSTTRDETRRIDMGKASTG